jgi:hypothetical protein
METAMPKQKDLKRLVRSRMKKTGESYTAARTQLLRKKSPVKTVAAPEPPASDSAALAGMSDNAVRAKTGRTWPEWTRELDAIGARQMTHRDIARHVAEKHRIGSWWAQTVTVGYERIRGLRERGQRRSGSYEANKSKTFPVSVGALYDAFASAKARARWLPGVALTLRTANANRSMRIAWPDGTRVELSFLGKGEKSQVAVQHTRLASKADAEERKEYWAQRLNALGGLFGR